MNQEKPSKTPEKKKSAVKVFFGKIVGAWTGIMIFVFYALLFIPAFKPHSELACMIAIHVLVFLTLIAGMLTCDEDGNFPS